MLNSLHLGDDEIKKVMEALAKLGQTVPRLSDEDMLRLTEQVSERLLDKFKRESRKLSEPTGREKFKQMVANIAVSLVAAGIWEILVYVSHHVVFHLASQGDDWRAEDSTRARTFRPTQSMLPDDRETLAKQQILLYAWVVKYCEELSARLKKDAEFRSIAQGVADNFRWDEKTMESFFYQSIIKSVHSVLVEEGVKLSLQNVESASFYT